MVIVHWETLKKNSEDPTSDDDAIYSVINWSPRPRSAATISSIVLFIGVPIIFHVLWVTSKLFKPRYLEEEKNNYGDDEKDDFEDEEL